MGYSKVDLAALIGSRICHDLISPIGAINNGLELLGMTSDASGAELELISESVENASARIRFFRVAYGAAGMQEMGRAEISAILEDYTSGGRLSVAWGPLDAQTRQEVQLAFLTLQCLETAMPYGGVIKVTKDGPRWHLHGAAPKLNVDDAMWQMAQGGTEVELSPAQVQFALLPALMADAGRSLTMQGTQTDIALQF
ncbi:MAG: histidine phosphotransferase family protein [Pseudomonadota bacterium]